MNSSEEESTKTDRPGSPGCQSVMSDDSMHRRIGFKGEPDCKSLMSEEAPSAVDDYVSIITNPPREETLELRPSPYYTEAGDVACDLCEGKKLRAYKSCMTCLASFCETHVRDHYSIPALQRHLLVEVANNLSILQENAQLKKMIKNERREKTALKEENLILRHNNQALKTEISTLRQTLSGLRLSADICNDFIVTVSPTDAAERCGLQGFYLLQTNFNSILLKDLKTGEVLYWWPYKCIRRYGANKATFSFEAGRRSDSGEGKFEFDTKQARNIKQCMESAINLHAAQHKKPKGQTADSGVHLGGITPPVATIVGPCWDNEWQASQESLEHFYHSIDDLGIESTSSHEPESHAPKQGGAGDGQMHCNSNDPSGHEYCNSPGGPWTPVQERGNDEDEDCDKTGPFEGSK